MRGRSRPAIHAFSAVEYRRFTAPPCIMKADLTGASFKEAHIAGVDFREAAVQGLTFLAALVRTPPSSTQLLSSCNIPGSHTVCKAVCVCAM